MRPMTDLQTALPGRRRPGGPSPRPSVRPAGADSVRGPARRRYRLAAWRRRHLLRERRARGVLRGLAQPRTRAARWPSRAVVGFFGDCCGPVGRGGRPALVLHALAAVAGLLVPRHARVDLVDATTAPAAWRPRWTARPGGRGRGGGAGGADVLALRTRWCSGRTCWPRPASTSSGPCSGCRSGRVESASSGDLVTRVTRDVSTMSESVRFGLPEAVIAAVSPPLLTVVAMLLNSPLLTLPLLVTGPVLIFSRAALPEAGAEGLHHRGRHLLDDQLQSDRDGRGRPDGGGAAA